MPHLTIQILNNTYTKHLSHTHDLISWKIKCKGKCILYTNQQQIVPIKVKNITHCYVIFQINTISSDQTLKDFIDELVTADADNNSYAGEIIQKIDILFKVAGVLEAETTVTLDELSWKVNTLISYRYIASNSNNAKIRNSSKM